MLEEELERGKRDYYRLFVLINSLRWRYFLLNFLSEFIKRRDKGSLSIGYAFHPWIEGAKDRIQDLKSSLNINSVIDIDYSRYTKYLGATFDIMILDAVDDFRPNYISALSDSVRGGGVIVLYSDNIENNKVFKNSLIKDGKVDNFFEERFLRLAKNHEGVLVIDEKGESFKPLTQKVQRPVRSIPEAPHVDRRLHELCQSKDQNKALEEMRFIMEGEDKRILAITAPRGRGKSSVTGLFLSFLVSERKFDNIIVTSPTYLSAQEIFSFLAKGLDTLGLRYKLTRSKDGKILSVASKEVIVKWLAPDLAKDYEGDLIIVDEAAALGLETVNYITSRWKKVVLVSTIHGYEGSGKAFLKYLNFLREKVKFKHITLTFPIRYAQGDPVERFLYDVMLLDAEPKPRKVNEAKVTELDKQSLFKNEGLLRHYYGILVSAHYRNSPDDLMILGDLHYERIFAMGEIGIAQVVEEGRLSKSEINTILNGGQSSGNLIPQRLIKYERVYEFGFTKGWRVIRIAIHPDYQGKGYGSALLSEIVRIAREEGLDWVGSSFTSDVKVLSFWIKNGFIPIYLSTRKNEGLNGYSIIVIKPLTDTAKRLSLHASELLREKVLRTAHQVYFNVNPLILANILRVLPKRFEKVEIPVEYKSKLEAYLSGYLPYNAVADAAHYVVSKYFSTAEDAFLNKTEEAVLIARTIQGKSWYHTSLYLDIKPRIAEEIMRGAIQKILERI